ncbi:MAG: hypothetical protein J1G01_03495 [Clostridiales bacterium]|nr:hypothetical protein [Clostridiales bacterium]
MITTKRQIRNESDRFGGYVTENNRSPLISKFDNIRNVEPSETSSNSVGSGKTVAEVDMNIKNTEIKQPLYTTIAAPQNAVTKSVELPKRPVKEEKPKEREDILPTVKTRKYATENVAASEEKAAAPVRRERRALDARTKVLLCVYIAVAIVLAIAVIATGVSISKASAQADMISRQVVQKQSIIREQEAALAGLLDDDVIRAKAMEQGMVQAGDPEYTAPSTETVEYPEATEHTNAFDEFCDWMSKMFG